MQGITIYTVKVNPNAPAGERIQITSRAGFEETPRTYQEREASGRRRVRELKDDMERPTYRGFMTTNPGMLKEGARLLIQQLKQSAEGRMNQARAELARVEGAERDFAAAFNTEVTA